MIWEMLDKRMTLEQLGFLPDFLDDKNPESARKQIDHNYSHGGGWLSQAGFRRTPNNSLLYPGDPPLRLLAKTTLRDEEIFFYPYSFVSIVQPDGSFEVARID